MKIINKLFWIALVLTGFMGCNNYSDSTYFNGEILPIDSRMKKVKNVKLSPVVPLNGANFEIIAVHGSFMFFESEIIGQVF